MQPLGTGGKEIYTAEILMSILQFGQTYLGNIFPFGGCFRLLDGEQNGDGRRTPHSRVQACSPCLGAFPASILKLRPLASPIGRLKIGRPGNAPAKYFHNGICLTGV